MGEPDFFMGKMFARSPQGQIEDSLEGLKIEKQMDTFDRELQTVVYTLYNFAKYQLNEESTYCK